MSRFTSGLKTGLAVIGGVTVIIVILAVAADRLGFVHFWSGPQPAAQGISSVSVANAADITPEEIERKLADKATKGEDRARLLFLKGEHLRQSADFDGAIGAYSEAVSIAPDMMPAYFARGAIHFNQAEFDEAVADFSRCLAIVPGLGEALERRAFSYAMLGQAKKASADIDALPGLDPYDVEAYARRGADYDMVGNYDRALIFYANAINVEPANADLYTNRALAFGNLGDYDRAVADFDTSLKLKPDDAFAYSRLGLTQIFAGRYGNAIDNYRKALALSGDKPDAYDVIWLHLAQARLRQNDRGQEDRAELFANAARLDQTSWPYPVISFYLGDLKAEDVLKAAEDTHELGNICEANFYVGYHFLLEGQTAQAKASFEDVTRRCHPGFIELQGARLELAKLAEKG